MIRKLKSYQIYSNQLESLYASTALSLSLIFAFFGFRLVHSLIFALHTTCLPELVLEEDSL